MQDDIAQSVVKELRTALLGAGTGSTAGVIAAAEVQAAVTGRTDNPEAYRLYLKGRSFLVGNQQEMDKSVDYFQQAVARAPDYAMAYAGLAAVYTRQASLRASDRIEAGEKGTGRADASAGFRSPTSPKPIPRSASSVSTSNGTGRGRMSRSGARWSSTRAAKPFMRNSATS